MATKYVLSSLNLAFQHRNSMARTLGFQNPLLKDKYCNQLCSYCCPGSYVPLNYIAKGTPFSSFLS